MCVCGGGGGGGGMGDKSLRLSPVPSSSNPVAMPIFTVHTVILTFGKMRMYLSPLTGQQ